MGAGFRRIACLGVGLRGNAWVLVWGLEGVHVWVQDSEVMHEWTMNTIGPTSGAA